MEYVTGTTIKKLREKQNLTQKELADKLMVSDKAVLCLGVAYQRTMYK